MHRTLTIMVLACLVSVAWSPIAVAESTWEEDGWLTTTLAQDRLDLGDEFGCYPGLCTVSYKQVAVSNKNVVQLSFRCSCF